MRDAQLRNAVQDALEREPRINASAIGVTAHDGIVTLSGLVPSYREKLAAGRTTKRVGGVEAVANDIELRLPGTTTDAEIARVAFDALKRQSSVPHEGINVTVTNGWIYLQGEVDGEYQKSAAEEAVRSLAGVKGVIKQITVRPKLPAPKLSAPEVKSRIKSAFSPIDELDPQNGSVECHTAAS